MSTAPLTGGRGARALAWRAAVTAGLTGWFAVTAASQHPNRSFDRLRRYDRSGLLIPNWRFFAPEPARHDFQVLHRVLTATGEEAPWVESMQVPPRTWSQTVWFPSRRRDKALFDTCHDLLRYMQAGRELTDSPSYLLLSDFVETQVRATYAGAAQPRGFQFLVVRHTGHDERNDPDYILVSHFVPLSPWSALDLPDTDPARHRPAPVPAQGGS